METIKIKYLRDIDKITRFNTGDWIDLRAAETVHLRQGETALIPLGVAMELPAGYEALIAARSSICKMGVMMQNGIGIIDESYRGDGDEWHFPAYAVRDTVIYKNDRICQFRIIEHQPYIQLREVDQLSTKNRGGIGSTGRA